MRDISISLYADAAPKLGFGGWVQRALGWPERALEARETMARLGELSEREWGDIEPGRRESSEGAGPVVDDDPAERQARVRAIRAWYRQGAEAA